MTQTVYAGQRTTVRLPAYHQMTVESDAVSSGVVYNADASRLGAVAASDSLVIGPYADARTFSVVPSAGTLTYGDPTPVDYQSPTETAAAFQPLLGSDVLDLVGEGAPVDYTDGTPPATGEGTAGIGSRYTDITAGKLYLNGGTKAEPVWKIVTSA